MKQVKVKKLREDAVLPVYKKGNSGFDFHALTVEKDGVIFNLDDGSEYWLNKYNTILIGTGLSFDFPENMELQIRSRSGLSIQGIVVANSPGTVDSNFKGEVKIILKNISNETFIINYKDRLAQGVFCPIYTPEIIEVNDIGESERGVNGFGSSGI
jgi:dUTP pyrophosphatase